MVGELMKIQSWLTPARQKMFELANRAGGDAPGPERPDTALLDEIRLAVGNDQIIALYNSRDELKTHIEEWHTIAEQITKCSPAWQTLQRLLSHCGDMKAAVKIKQQTEEEIKLAAAEFLKKKLEQILEGESPHDIFVRWKPIDKQAIGWYPDLNDGVRLNIRPFLTVGDVKKKDAGLFPFKPNIKWNKDRGKDVSSAPWYQLGPKYDGKEGDRINDHHLTLAEKQTAKAILDHKE